MKKIISIFMAILVLSFSVAFADLVVIPKVQEDTKVKFKDLDSSHWAYEPIMKMTERGVIKGYPDDTFGPEKNVTRAEFAKIVVATLGIDTSKTNRKNIFADVPSDHWALEYILAASEYLTGYLDGETLTYEPEAKATRDDIAVAVVIASGLGKNNYNPNTINKFTDAKNISDDIKSYIAIAVENNIISGFPDGTFRPSEYLTRAQVCQLMVNLLKVVDDVQVPATCEHDPVMIMYFDVGEKGHRMERSCVKCGEIVVRSKTIEPHIYDSKNNRCTKCGYVRTYQKSEYFSDLIKENAKYAEAVDFLTDFKTIDGFPDSTFRPDELFTRAQFAKLMICMTKVYEENYSGDYSSVFSDVAKNHWAYEYIMIADNNKYIVHQKDGTFKPEEAINYAEVIYGLEVALGYYDEIGSQYVDVQKIMDVVTENKLKFLPDEVNEIIGDGNIYAKATRGNIALLAYNALNTKVKNSSKTLLQTIQSRPTAKPGTATPKPTRTPIPDVSGDVLDKLVFDAKTLSIDLGPNWENSTSYSYNSYVPSQRYLVYNESSSRYSNKNARKTTNKDLVYSCTFDNSFKTDAKEVVITVVYNNVAKSITVPNPFIIESNIDSSFAAMEAGSKVKISVTALNKLKDLEFDWSTNVSGFSTGNVINTVVPDFGDKDYVQLKVKATDIYDNYKNITYMIFNKKVVDLDYKLFTVSGLGVDSNNILLTDLNGYEAKYSFTDYAYIPKEIKNANVVKNEEPLFVICGLEGKNKIGNIAVIDYDNLLSVMAREEEGKKWCVYNGKFFRNYWFEFGEILENGKIIDLYGVGSTDELDKFNNVIIVISEPIYNNGKISGFGIKQVSSRNYIKNVSGKAVGLIDNSNNLYLLVENHENETKPTTVPKTTPVPTGLLPKTTPVPTGLVCINHTWTNKYIQKDTSSHIVQQVCTRCGTMVEKGKEAHNYKAATCTAPSTCSLCGATRGSALGHKMGEWKNLNVSGETGEYVRTCSRCKFTEVRTDIVTLKPTKKPTTKVPTTKTPTPTKKPTTKVPTTKTPATKKPTTKIPTTKTPIPTGIVTIKPTTKTPTPTKNPTTKIPTTKTPTPVPTGLVCVSHKFTSVYTHESERAHSITQRCTRCGYVNMKATELHTYTTKGICTKCGYVCSHQYITSGSVIRCKICGMVKPGSTTSTPVTTPSPTQLPQDTIKPKLEGNSISISMGTIFKGKFAYCADNIGVTSLVIKEKAKHGTVSNLKPDGSFVYTPESNYVGIDSFTAIAKDKAGNASEPAKYTITIIGNDDTIAPSIQDYEANTNKNFSYSGTIKVNDNVRVISLILKERPKNGTVSNLKPDGSFVYKPNTNFVGVDSFKVVATDMAGNMSKTAIITINVVDKASTGSNPSDTSSKPSKVAIINILDNATSN